MPGEAGRNCSWPRRMARILRDAYWPPEISKWPRPPFPRMAAGSPWLFREKDGTGALRLIRSDDGAVEAELGAAASCAWDFRG